MITLEEQIRLHKHLSCQIDALERQRKELSASILNAMTTKTLYLGPYHVQRITRLSIKLSLEEARALNILKIQETIDRDKVKLLHKSGKAIPGVSENHHIQIFELP